MIQTLAAVAPAILGFVFSGLCLLVLRRLWRDRDGVRRRALRDLAILLVTLNAIGSFVVSWIALVRAIRFAS